MANRSGGCSAGAFAKGEQEMEELLPFLIALVVFPLSLLATRIPRKLLAYLQLGLAAGFLSLGFLGVRFRWPWFFLATLLAGMALHKAWLSRKQKS
jgi:hypothetical protein